jgi:hypothetical protein
MLWLYGEILKAKEEIRIAVGNVDKNGTGLYKSIIEIVDEKNEKTVGLSYSHGCILLKPLL